jgi:acylphosphatase
MHVRIEGRVQGVFFRDFTLREARALEVTGWVRNLSNGGVEAVLEGEEGSVRALIGRLERGPPHARVERVEVVEEVDRREFDDFSILY